MPTSTSFKTTNTRTFTPKPKQVALGHVDKYAANLEGVQGARELISIIRNRGRVTKLTLGHNPFGEEGALELFQFLCSDNARKYREKISEISLMSCYIGDSGMMALAEYLEGNAALKELSLQNGDPEAVLSFVHALNTSTVETLNLDTNLHLSDNFLTLFLSHLNAPHLRVLHISTIGLSSASAPHIVAFLRSPRSRHLETFKCNGNSLGLTGMQAIVACLRGWNATLQHAEFYANFVPEEAMVDGRDPKRREMWKEVEAGIKRAMTRNDLLKRRVAKEAVRLLPYARALLMTTSTGSLSSSPTSSSSSFPFPSLPIELQRYILSFLAPSLSATQFAHVLSYASDPTTLPQLLPSLNSGHNCMPDPSSMPFMHPHLGSSPPGSGIGIGFGLGMPGFQVKSHSKSRSRGTSIGSISGISSSSSGGGGGGCSGGTCMGSGSVSCHRNKARVKWLAEVGCSRCDVAEGLDVDSWAVDVLREDEGSNSLSLGAGSGSGLVPRVERRSSTSGTGVSVSS